MGTIECPQYPCEDRTRLEATPVNEFMEMLVT